MGGKKKFGAFAGVFTPSILTILGVIMYMRLGWVIGNAGLVGTIVIILIAHVIAVSTGLSVSSVATDKKIGAGGIYYVLSRSMGIPIGGSIGIALYVGTAFSISLYLIGFAESFNDFFDLGTTINDLRMSGTVGLIALTALALISTSAALKAQFFILAAIIVSLVSIFLGTSNYVPETVQMFSTDSSVSLEIVFAIFFPAVTGFTAGIAMSGDLKDPKKAIPVGTLAAISVGLVVYIGLAVFIAYRVDSTTLSSNYNILMDIALYAPAVVAGIWGATLSSALGGILGGPRILQAMSIDKVTPQIFGRGKGKNNEPINALLLVFLIAEAGILIGELDVIARVVSMFYLTAYGFINISYFLESWANPDFQPTFKIKRWIGLVGFIACFAVMFKLDMIAMFGSFAVVGGLYFWLQRKQIHLQSNDVWQSVWSNVVNKGLKKLDTRNNESSGWNPNILLFTGDSKHRPQLLEFSKTLSGRMGVVTDFKMTSPKSSSPMSKTQQSYKDVLLENLDIYGRQIETDDPYQGVENIASSYGFTGLEPNTVMMNWSKSSSNPEKYDKMTQKLIHLDYNLLYLDYDERTKYGKYKTIDLWWRETDSKNAELMLYIARYIAQSPHWSKAKIRILYVNQENSENTPLKTKIKNLLESLRIDAEIKIINNSIEHKSFYKIIQLQSSSTDLILLGVPNVIAEEQANYILNTDQLFETVGTTLLVRASDDFNKLELESIAKTTTIVSEDLNLSPLSVSEHSVINELVKDWSNHLQDTAHQLEATSFVPVSDYYCGFLKQVKLGFGKFEENIHKDHTTNKIIRELQSFSSETIELSERFKNSSLLELEETFKVGLDSFLADRKLYISQGKKRVQYLPDQSSGGLLRNSSHQIRWREILKLATDTDIYPNLELVLKKYGTQCFILLVGIVESIKEVTNKFTENIDKTTENRAEIIERFISSVQGLLNDGTKNIEALKSHVTNHVIVKERELCSYLIDRLHESSLIDNLKSDFKKISKRRRKENTLFVETYTQNWSNIQLLSHGQVEADLSLGNSGLSLFTINDVIKKRIDRLTTNPQSSSLSQLNEALAYIENNIDDIDSQSEKLAILEKVAEGSMGVDFNQILTTEEDRILSIGSKSQKTTSLMSAYSFNLLQEEQGDAIEKIEVSLRNIQNYIIRSSYLDPLQDSLFNLESVYSKINEKLYNIGNLVKHILADHNISGETKDTKKKISKVKSEVQQSIDKLAKTEATFKYDLYVHVRDTISTLDIRAIIESIDSYSRISKKPVRSTSYRKWSNSVKKNLKNRYDEATEFIGKRRRDVDSLKFTEKNVQLLNNIERSNDFVDQLQYQNGVEAKLPFYYKKLFSGSHLGSVNSIYHAKELGSIHKALGRIDSGVNGAIAILGESLSGKSYFTETISNKYPELTKYFFTPPLSQKYTEKDLDSSFGSVLGKSGSTLSLLSALENKSILIFEDIERWWLKSENGNQAINYLSKIIEQFGSQHYFIITSNIYSYEAICKTTSLESSITATTIISPSGRAEIKQVLINRHRTAGADIWYNNNLVNELKKMDTLFSEIHLESGGNMGVAIETWKYSISKNDTDQLVLNSPKDVSFPKITNAHWKSILYLMVLHGGISNKQIDRIFVDTNWVYETLKEIVKSGLIENKTINKYTFTESSKHYVEEWLKNLNILR